MALMSDPLKEQREMIAAFSDPMKEFRESMAWMSDPLKEQCKMIAAFLDPMKEFRESMAWMSDPLKEQREMIEAFSDPMKEFRESMALMSDPFSSIHNSITNSISLKSIKNIALEVQADIEIDEDGVVSFESKRIAASELQELSNKVLLNSSLSEPSSLEESIHNLVNEIRTQKDPLTQKLVIHFLYPLIIVIIASFINPVADNYVKSKSQIDRRAIAKELKYTVNSAVENKEILSTLRFVSADILNIRVSNSVKSETIGYLRFSSAVLVIEKRKNWTLIEWNNPDTEAKIKGWVFSRYLAKFK